MEAFTAKSYIIGKAPRKITLLGDKTKKPEPAQHIIEFPGGAVEVSRTSDNNYWAHIIINNDQFADGDGGGRTSARGVVVGSRLDREDTPLEEIPGGESLHQIAVLVSARR